MYPFFESRPLRSLFLYIFCWVPLFFSKAATKNLAGFPFPFRPWILAANGCTGPNLRGRNALVAQEAIASAAPCQYCLSRRNERARTASFFFFPEAEMYY
jgi:hypothetical protein